MRRLLLCIAASIVLPVPAMACTNPAGDEGEIVYNSDHAVMQFCNGTNWVAMAATDPSQTLDSLTNVADPLSPSPGQVLTWDNGAGEWVAADAAGGGWQVPDDASACPGAPSIEGTIRFNSGKLQVCTATGFADVGSGAAGGAWTVTGNDVFTAISGGVGIGTGGAPTATAALEVASTSKGFLPPRMTEVQRDAIGTPATGLMIFNTDEGEHQFWNGSTWRGLGSVGESAASFTVFKTVDQTVAIGTILTWDGKLTDTHNAFDLAQERFTAPIAGQYYFHADVLSDDVVTPHGVQFFKNGVATGMRSYGGANGGEIHRQATLSAVIELAAGDYVDVRSVYPNSQIYGQPHDIHTRFSGFLLSGGGSGSGKFVDGTNAADAVFMGGNVGIGTTTPVSQLHVTAQAGGTRGITIGQHDNAASAPTLNFYKSRGTEASPTAVQAGDVLMAHWPNGWNGTQYMPSATVRAVAQENFTSTASGTFLELATTPPGTNTRTVRMTITGEGNVGIGTASPTAKLDVSGSIKATSVETPRHYTKSYNVNNTTSLPIVGFDGNPLPLNSVLKMFCTVTSTNITGTSYWMVKRWPNGTVSIERIASFGSTTSNTPEIFDNSGVPSIRLYNHTVMYEVRCLQEQLL